MKSWTLVLVVPLLASAGALQAARERTYPPVERAEESLTLTSGTALKHLTTGYNALAADLYWIRAIQYFGGVRLHLMEQAQNPAKVANLQKPDYRLLYPLLDVTTSLDPQFNIAYRFGSIFLAEGYPGGAGRPDLAIALLEKGLAQRPDKWEYMQDIGFVHYWWRRDYKAAADWFARAADVPGAPWFLRSLAATTLAEGGDRESSRAVWEAIRESAEIDWLRHDAERRLLQLRALDELDEMQKHFDAGETLRAIPLDPTGTPYEIDAARHIHLSPKSSLYPLPDEPKHLINPAS